MLRLGIAGIGAIARDYIGLICNGRVPGVGLTALCSRSVVNMEAVVAEHPALSSAARFTDYTAMLSSGTIDAVLICTPHMQHPEMTRQALESGLHVLVEKPVGAYPDEVESALDVLRRRPALTCGVLYNRRASAAFRYVKTLIDAGVLGKRVRCTWLITNLYRTNAYYRSGSWRGTWQGEGGGLLMTQASHQLDLLQWLWGMPVSVQARCATVGRPIEVENDAQLFLTYPDGSSGQFIASAHECPGSNLLELCGTRGRITVREDSTVEVLRLEQDEQVFAVGCSSPFERVPYTTEHFTFDDSDNKLQQAATIENFARAVLGQESVQCSLEEGFRSLQLIHGAYLSHWSGCAVPLPAPSHLFRQELERRGI